MRLGILSDTHGYWHPALDSTLQGVDTILHAGDVGTPDILDRLEAIAPTYAVYGNVDGNPIRHRAPRVQRLRLAGVRIMMVHIGGHPDRWAKGIRSMLINEPPDMFICGHSHILRMERITNPVPLLYVNPGAAGRQGFHRVKTVIRIDMHDGRPTQAEVVHLDETNAVVAPAPPQRPDP